MSSSLAAKGNSLHKVKFKRLDNSTGPDKVTADDFAALSHDNEFDILLGDCAINGSSVGGPMALQQVWGFVMHDGRRGLIKTSEPQAYPDNSLFGTPVAIQTVNQPTAGGFTLYCMIKMQDNK